MSRKHIIAGIGIVLCSAVLLYFLGNTLDRRRYSGDVTEELTRLRSHIEQFRRIANEKGPVGRRLDFLLQEMAREASTTGAKSQHADLQHAVVDMRAEVARMREQVQNIE